MKNSTGRGLFFAKGMPSALVFSIALGFVAILPASAQKKPAKATNAKATEKKDYEPEVKQLVSFLEYTLNSLGGNDLSAKEKEVIVNNSYKKLFRDDKVQIEDDLDEHRVVVTNKDVRAYLKDVDFFFKWVKFKFNIDKITQGVNQEGQVYFTVKLNRELKGVTIRGDSVDNVKERYIEINVNDQAQDLRIASIYTTKLSNDDELRAWWAGVSPEWKLYLGSDQLIMEGLRLSEVQSFTDSTFEVNGIQYPNKDSVKILPFVKAVTNKEEVDISNSTSIQDLDPLDEMNNLKRLNISHTAISDLFPVRNLTTLEYLNCASTQVHDLSPLRYSRALLELDISNTPVTSVAVLGNFSDLQKLDMAHTVIDSLPAMTALSKLRELDVSSTNIVSLDSIGALKNLEQLNFSNTTVSDLAPLAALSQLKHLEFNQTPVADLAPLAKLANLEFVSFYGTQVALLGPLEGLKNLKKVFCDNTQVTRDEYVKFYKKRPDCEVVFSSEKLETYWKKLPKKWKDVIAPLIHLDSLPNREQLHNILKIQEIDIHGKKEFDSLDPLKILIDLQSLNIAGTSITDLSPLTAQSSLEKIDFSGDSIADISPLAGHTGLTVIKGNGARVTDISALKGCQKLDSIFFNNTKISDIRVLNKVRGFKIAYFEHTHVADSIVADLTYNSDSSIVVYRTEALETWWGNMDSEWQNIFRENYHLPRNPSTEQLHWLAGRQQITAKSVLLNNLDPMPVFVRLKSLTFTDSQIKSIAPLAGLLKLEELNFPRNPIEDIGPLKRLKALRILDIDNNPVKDIEALSGLENLEEVKINGTEVRDLEPLAAHYSLRVLECSNTRVKRLRALLDLPNIKVLKCFNTRLSSKEVEAFKKAHPDCEVVYY